MPGTLRVKVVEARNLPVMDRSAETTDAFVEIHFGGESYKTDICPKSLSPRWNSEWFVFEAEDHELQDECLQLRIMDYDIYSANDSIGRVYFDVNPLVEAAHRKITDIKDDRPAATWTHSADMIGWLPIYDTLNGHRGELRIEVQLELFADTNKLRESSCGVQVFVAGRVPPGQRLIEVHGLVHDLLTAGDPEYQWLDKIRTPRATNEARQALLRRLSSELTRKIGRKVLEMGANAVLGYRQCVDVEGEASDMLVVRAIGTAVTLVDETQTTVNRAPSPSSPNKAAHHRLSLKLPSSSGSSEGDDESEPSHSTDSMPARHRRRGMTCPSTKRRPVFFRQATNATLAIEKMYDGDISADPRLTSSSLHSFTPKYPFLTMDSLPKGVVRGLGASVCARSVRLLADAQEQKESAEAVEARNGWWAELRWEIRSHMKSLACNAVLDYKEEFCTRDGVCILSCTGTAILTADQLWARGHHILNENSLLTTAQQHQQHANGDSNSSDCAICHVPYSDASLPFPISLLDCASCGAAKCPDIILATCAVPDGVISGRSLPVQTSVVRKLSNTEDDEDLATEISDLLPFVEHQLHSNLLTELRTARVGRNAIFGMKTVFTLGDGLLVAVTTGLAATLRPLVSPEDPLTSSASAPAVAPQPKRSFLRTALSSPVFELKKLELAADQRDVICVPLNGEEKENTPSPSAIVAGQVVERGDGQQKTASPFRDLRRLSWGSMREAIRLTTTRNDAQSALRVPTASTLACKQTAPSLLLDTRLWQGKTAVDGSSPEKKGDGSPEGKKVRKRLDRLVQKLRRRHHDKEDFASAVFQREVTLRLGVIAEAVTDTAAFYPNLAGLVLFGVATRLAPFNRNATDGDSEVVSISTSHEMIGEGNANIMRQFVGHYDSFFIRETSALKELGGLDAFIRVALDDIVRAVQCYVRAIGGDALVSFRLTLTDLTGSLAKNQAQCLLGVAGDIIHFTRTT